MKEKFESINKDFYNNISDIYLEPTKINKYLRKHSNVIENSIKRKFKDLNLHENFVIYANGGFGRKEMFPTSDVDISIVEIKKNKNFDNLEKFISYLWDQGFKVGHSVRKVKDIKNISKSDIKEFTSYLTRRPIISNKDIDKEITMTLCKLWTKNNFYNEKYIEQQKRHNQFFSTAFNLEPDLKESPGTMRDFQTALWILQHCFGLDSQPAIKKSKLLDGQYKNTVIAYNFIKFLRFHANLLTDRNRLSFESQIEISKNINSISEKDTKSTVEKMMRKYYEMAEYISYFNSTVFEKYNETYPKNLFKNANPIYKHKSKIGINENIDIKTNKDLIFKLFIEIGKSKKINLIDTETKALLRNNLNLIDQEFRKDKYFAEQFLDILKSKHNLSSILKTMKSLGILQRYIPEFGEVVGQMQFDLFHVYTVDEHTLKVVRNMNQMKLYGQEGFLLEHELINKIPKIEILYIAGLFHDLGKGKGGDHSEIGAKTSFNFAKRLGMSSTDAKLISWLVKKHLIMSSISQKKDISDPLTINDFAKEVEQNEKLNYLYLLTVNDIRATNPALWNGWKHQLLRDLYTLTRSKINKNPIKASSDIALDRKNSVLSELNKDEKSFVKNYFSKFSDSYFNKNATESLKWQSQLIIQNKNCDLVIACKNKFDNLLEIFIKVDNSEGLFLKLTKTLEKSGLEIIDANIFTSTDDKLAANTFITKFSHHDRALNQSELKELSIRIIKNFNNYEDFSDSIKNAKKKIKFQNKLNITNTHNTSKGRNLITIETSDRPGLLSDIARVFYDNNLSIFSARINTLGDKVEDTFELENFNKTLIPNKKMKEIIASLKKVV
ncbi:MAG: [protein-PII] uridylyltransferase [Pseudomonadota bacterium]|nr:[protein-PII] uridylyltransferase [Pseudomonadota bacterium]